MEEKKVLPAQLAFERESWRWFLDNLSGGELLDPYPLINAIFEDVKPQEFRDHLSEWLHAALSTDAIDEGMTTSEIITIYEHLLKLYSAA
jgi:hypothetical protein